MERFVQRRLALNDETSTGKLKVKTLLSLIERHPYRDAIINAFNLAELADEVIVIDHIDVLYKKVKRMNDNFERFEILAYNKDISIRESANPIKDIKDQKPLIFSFNNYLHYGEEAQNLEAFAIYDSKNTFFDEYDMAKFANRLYKDDLGILADYNIKFFKDLADNNVAFKNYKSYRLVKNGEETFLRGITSIDKYFEYGVDFSFVVSMLILHRDMKDNGGNAYTISSAAISESKMEIIVAEKALKDAGEFGNVSSAFIVTTNDLGTGSLNFTKIIKVGVQTFNGLYLFPANETASSNKLIISHSTKCDKALQKLDGVFALLSNTEEFIQNLKDLKGISTPEELRQNILIKLTNPRSVFKEIGELKDIFKTAISNEIASFAKLLDMCEKAEELDIDYDIKDKLRYLISDIILSGWK